MTTTPKATPPLLPCTVPLRTRIGWGFGGIADNFIMNAMNGLGLIIYTTHFKLDPFLAGLAMFIPRFIDAIADPIIGNISDNTRTRMGRRRPYMIWGALLTAFLLPFVWLPPFVSTVSAPWYANVPFLYFTIIGIIYALCYSLFVVPYTALGFELTNDYDERTRVLAWRMYLGLLASMLVSGLYWFCQLRIFPNEGVGAICVSIGVAMIIIVTGLIPVVVCRENEDTMKQATIPILPAIRYSFTNMPFMILSVAYIVIITALFSAGNLMTFINVYYVCGTKEFAGRIGFIMGFLSACTSYLSMFLIAAVSRRWSKGVGMNMGLAFALVGVMSQWIALDPRWPYAQLGSAFVMMLGLQGCWLMVSSMIADVCDQDELKSGVRQEGIFGAINAFTLKLALAITSLAGGFLIKFSGFDQTTADQIGITHETAIKMKTLIVGLQAVGLALAIFIFIFYPISRERAAETRRLLEERHRQQKSEREDEMPVAVKAG